MLLDILWHWYIQWWPFSWLLCTSEHSLHRCRCWPRCRCTCKVSLLKLHWYRVFKMLPSFQGLLVSRTQRQVTKKRGMMNDPAVLGCGLNESKKTTNLGGGNSIFFTPNLGEIIQSDEHIFEMGWFNHQLECKYPLVNSCSNQTRCFEKEWRNFKIAWNKWLSWICLSGDFFKRIAYQGKSPWKTTIWDNIVYY